MQVASIYKIFSMCHCRSKADASLLTKGSGCKGSNAFMELPNHDPTTQTIPDAMHTIKDAVVNLYDIIVGKDDTVNCRLCELNHGERFGITSHEMVQEINRKEPCVPYSLSAEEIKRADDRAKSIVTPQHIDFVPGIIFTKTANLKSHDWKQVTNFTTS